MNYNIHHQCFIKNELNQIMDISKKFIEDPIFSNCFVYDSRGEFIVDFSVNYCPNCGVKLLEGSREVIAPHC